MELENYPFIAKYDNKIKITCSDENPTYKVVFPKEKPIELKGSSTFYYNPKEFIDGNFFVIFNKDTIKHWYDVASFPNPTIYFDSTNHNVLVKDEIYSANLKAKWKNNTCKILSYKLVTIKKIKNGFGFFEESFGNTKISSQDTTFKMSNKNIVSILSNGDDFYLKNILVELPDGTTRMIDSKRFKIVKNAFYGNFCREVDFNNSIPISVRKLYCNLRIKIETDVLIKKRDVIEQFFDELNHQLNGCKVKITNTLPDLIFTNKDYSKHSEFKRDFFYPNVITTDEIGSEYGLDNNNNYGPKQITDDRFIEIVLGRVGVGYNNKTILKDSLGYYHLTTECKNHLNNLYAIGSINRIYKELNEENPYDNKQDYTLIIVIISFLIFLIIREFILSTTFGRIVLIKKHSLWKQLIFIVLITQIPLSIVLLIKKFNDFEITLNYFQTAEIYYIVYGILAGTMLWSLNKLQKKIKRFAFRLLIDFVLTVTIFWMAYQIIFIATHLDWVRIDMFRWQWIYIPLSVAIYRIYNLFNQRKIDQLIQEKELDVSKQKELTTKAELLALQSRINPHFLYNSLNSIASLAAIDTHKTEQMAIDLAKLFRYNLNKAEDLMTTVEQELEMVKLYLNIEKQRFGERLDYQVNVPIDLLEFPIPIFLLQPLVENAIKHGVSKITEDGKIKIKIEEDNKFVFIKVYDNGPLFTNELIFGYGLQNIFDKLTLVYKDNYTVRFVNEAEKHIEIKIALK